MYVDINTHANYNTAWEIWGTLREKQSVKNAKEIHSIILTWLSFNIIRNSIRQTIV